VSTTVNLSDDKRYFSSQYNWQFGRSSKMHLIIEPK